jgi:hypothetical protein
MTDILEISSVVLVLSLLAFALAHGVIATLKIKDLDRQLVQSKIDNNHIKSSLANALLEIESKKLETTDGFVSFLSQSREQAFNYIEYVEKSFEELDIVMQKIFQWEDSYGSANGVTAHTEAISEIRKAYEQYKSTMPNNTNNK